MSPSQPEDPTDTRVPSTPSSSEEPAAESIFGVILAGGQSRRFGGAKVFAELGGAPMASWGVQALQGVGLAVGVVADAERVWKPHSVSRLDPIWNPDSAPLAGYGRRSNGPRKEEMMVCCFSDATCPSCLRQCSGLSSAGATRRRPWCPWARRAPSRYARFTELRVPPAVEDRLRSEDRSLHGLAQAVRAVFIGEEAVAEVTDPRVAFLNVNTVEDRDRAERFLDARG